MVVNRPVQIAKRVPEVGSADGRENVAATVVRALDLLDVLVADPRGIGLSEAARRGGLNKATAFRLLAALKRAGVVVQDGSSGQYRPGFKLVRIGEQVAAALDFRTIAHPYVAELAGQVGHGVLAGVIEDGMVVYVDHVEGSDGLRVHRQVGGRRSVHVSSIGKAILAHLPSAEIQTILDGCRFEARTEQTIVDRTTFLAGLDEVRRRGWALVRDEDIVGGSSLSAPVFDHTGAVVGAIGVAGPSFVLRGATLKRAADLLVRACREVSRGLGQPEPAAISDALGHEQIARQSSGS